MVIADLQLGDAGLLPQAGFQLGQNALGVVADGTQLVHLGVVAFGDDTAILEGRGRFRIHRRINTGLDVLQRVDLCCQLGQLRAAAGFSLPAQAGQTVAGLGQRIDLLRGGRAVDRAGHQALHVEDVAAALLSGRRGPWSALYKRSPQQFRRRLIACGWTQAAARSRCAAGACPSRSRSCPAPRAGCPAFRGRAASRSAPDWPA